MSEKSYRGFTKDNYPVKGEIRKDVNNKNKWVFVIYYAEKKNSSTYRPYPQIISVRYKSRKSAYNGFSKYLATDKLDWNDE